MVKVGVHNLTHSYQLAPIKLARIHERYTQDLDAHDIAILKTEQPLNFTLFNQGDGAIGPIRLPAVNDDDANDDYIDGQLATVAG